MIRSTRQSTTLPPVLCALLPVRLTQALQSLTDAPEELHLYAGRTATVRVCGRTQPTGVVLSEEELSALLKQMCGGSLYAYAETINRGYLTLDGGIRVGVCGSASCEGGRVVGVNRITGLTVRIPHAVDVPLSSLAPLLSALSDGAGLLLFSPPGVGKTTLLRALAKQLSSPPVPKCTVVVDSREELVGTLDGKDLFLDVLAGYPRDLGIEIAVRSLAAEVVLCDEIGSRSDAEAILAAANCGVPIVATAHARSVRELLLRPPLRRLHDAHVFSAYAGLSRTGSSALNVTVTDWQTAERIGRSL